MKLQLEIDELTRRRTAFVLSVGGWLTSFTLVVLDSTGVLPRTSIGIVIVFIIGVAIAASTARTRMRLRDTIVQTFKAGTDAMRMQLVADREEDARSRRADRAEDTAQRQSDRDKDCDDSEK